MKWLWASAHYWPIWLGVTVGTFLLRELWALISKHSQDTLSDWVWNQLHIVTRESITQWSAADLMLFIAYIGVFVAWLPWHFWFRDFTQQEVSMAASRAPVEAKTQAAGVAGVVSGAVIWLLQTYAFKGTLNPGLVSLIYTAVPGILAFGAAYLAPHTPRPAPPQPAVPATGNVTITPPAT